MKKLILTFGFFLLTILSFGQETKFVNAEELNIRSGAGTKYEIVDKTVQGQNVTVLSKRGKWSEIELESGIKGFVSTKFLSDNTSSFSNSGEKSSWIGYVILIGLILYGLSKKGKMQGNAYQVDKEPLLEIPIYKPAEKDANEIGKLVEKIISLKQQGKDSSEQENKIDELVFKLYEITPEEQKKIENL